MSRPLALLVIGLVFGSGAGFLFAAANGVTLDGHDHGADHGHLSDASSADETHDHERLAAVALNETAPSLTIALHKDTDSGWNLNIQTTGFAFAPRRVGKDHREGEGHAHVYVNGAKIARVYGPWFHLGTLPQGEVEVRVTLNANDHRALSVDGAPVEIRTTILNAP